MTDTDGRRAESLAGEFLQRQGLALLEKNWRSRFGEIDLVCAEGETIVFVEVRLRTNARFGSPGESIHGRKRSRLLAAARQYLSGQSHAACRFDAVLFKRLDPPDFEWIRDAISE